MHRGPFFGCFFLCLSLFFAGFGLFTFRLATFGNQFLRHIHFRRRRSACPGGHPAAIGKVSVRGSATHVHIYRAFKFAVDHVAVVNRVRRSVRIVPRDRPKACRITFLVPRTRPRCRFARLGSSVPNRCFTVSSLLIFAGRTEGDAPEQAESKENRSNSHSRVREMESKVTVPKMPQQEVRSGLAALSGQTSLPIGAAPSRVSQPQRRQNSRPRGLSFATRMFARSRPTRFKPARHSSIKRLPRPRP